MRVYIFIYVLCCVAMACESNSTSTMETAINNMMQSNPIVQDLNPFSPSTDAFTSSADMGGERIDMQNDRLDMMSGVDFSGITDMHGTDMHGTDMHGTDMHTTDMYATGARSLIRAPCAFTDPQSTQLTPVPQTCMEMYQRNPSLPSGCYRLRQLDGREDHGYCWRKKALVLLVNNDIDSETHPDDLDGDGVIDQGEYQGHNHPADPLGITPYDFAVELQQETYDYFAEISYNTLQYDLEVYWASPGYFPRTDINEIDTQTHERWYRLQRQRPTFANDQLMHDVCMRRGGMTEEAWRSFDIIVTIVNYGTTTSGSQWRAEDLPIGEQCDQTASIWRNYVVAKQFRSWNRLGTYFHEIIHGLARDPLPEPSIGHSESIHPETDEYTEYGDVTDVMGQSSNRGHISLPQKIFLRYLPLEIIRSMEITESFVREYIAPLETDQMTLGEKRGVRIEVNQGLAYHVEVRRAIGNDQRLPAIFHQGALIKKAKSLSEANKSFIVDPTPETLSQQSRDYVLLPQRTFSDHENQVYISAISSDENGVDVIIRRGEKSSAPPIINQVESVEIYDNEGQVTAWQLTASAQVGDEQIDTQDLLYFWKLGSQGRLYTEDSFRVGMQIQISREEAQNEVWLVVSDQRGGESWHLVSLMDSTSP